MVSHANVVSNLAMLSAISAPEHELPRLHEWNVVSWLPQFHDMGLIGVVLYGLYNGASTRLMSPMSFLKRPIRWLQAIAGLSDVIGGSPNFGYDLCVRRIKDEELEGLDLSSWNSAFCGSEPVRPQTMAAFAERFAPCGFRREALLPCYGLAETTLGVAGRRHGQAYRTQDVDQAALEQGRARAVEGEAASLRVTSCGLGAPGQELAIVDPSSFARLGDEQVGEIWVRGPHVARGYWNDPERSQATFGATIEGEDPTRTYLRTGDLGFVRDDELYVTGRLKEIILVRGRCIYPQDLELAIDGLAARFPELSLNESFAFALPGAEREGVGLVAKINRRKNREHDPQLLIEAIQREVGEAFELTFTHIALVRAAPPKTTSGKKMRGACRELMRAGELEQLKLEHLYLRDGAEPGEDLSENPGAEPEAVEISPRQHQLNTLVLDWIAEETQLPRASLSPNQPLTEIALDSLALVNLIAELEQELDMALSSELFERARTVNHLSASLCALLPPEAPAQRPTTQARALA